MSDAAILETVFLQGRYAGAILARGPKGYETRTLTRMASKNTSG